MRNDWELRSDQPRPPAHNPTHPLPSPSCHVLFSHSVCVRPAFSGERKAIALLIYHPHPPPPPSSCLLSSASLSVSPPRLLEWELCTRCCVALRACVRCVCVCVSLSLDSLLVYSAAYILPFQVPRVLLASQTLGTCS